MKNKRILSILAVLFLGLVPVKIHSADGSSTPVIVNVYPVENGSGFGEFLTKRNVKGSAAGLAVTAALYGLYQWYYQEPSNAELRENAQKVYDRLDNTYSKIELKRYPAKMNITKEGDLFALANPKDLKKIKRIGSDLSELNQHIALLSKRLAKKAGKDDKQMKDLHARMIILRNELARIHQFWNTHAPFFSTHELLTELSKTYNQYDYQNVSATKRQIRSNGVGQLYPFKTFAETLAQNIDSLQNRIKQLHKKMKTFSDQPIIATDYCNLINQAEAFCQAIIPLQDVVANFDEYASDVRRCNEDWHQQQQRATQLRGAQLKAEAEREKARAEEKKASAQREKADAIRYKARCDLMKDRQRNQHVTVVVQNPNNNQNQ